MAAGGLSLLALGVYSAKGFTNVTAKYIESRLGEYNLTIVYNVTCNVFANKIISLFNIYLKK